MVQASGFKVQGVGFGVEGFQSSGFRVEGLGPKPQIRGPYDPSNTHPESGPFGRPVCPSLFGLPDLAGLRSFPRCAAGGCF